MSGVFKLLFRELVQPCLDGRYLAVDGGELRLFLGLVLAELFEALDQAVGLIFRGGLSLKELSRVVVCYVPDKFRSPAIRYRAYRRRKY